MVHIKNFLKMFHIKKLFKKEIPPSNVTNVWESYKIVSTTHVPWWFRLLPTNLAQAYADFSGRHHCQQVLLPVTVSMALPRLWLSTLVVSISSCVHSLSVFIFVDCSFFVQCHFDCDFVPLPHSLGSILPFIDILCWSYRVPKIVVQNQVLLQILNISVI